MLCPCAGHRQNQSGLSPQMAIQSSAATNLHLDAHVPFGPCGYEELTQFSKAPSLFEYQILLVDADRAFHIKSFGSPAPRERTL